MIKFSGKVLKFDSIDTYGMKFSKDCTITVSDKVPVFFDYNNDSMIGYADISKVEDGLNCEVSLFNKDVYVFDDYYVGGYYTDIKSHREGDITVIDSGKMISMSIISGCTVQDSNLKIRRIRRRKK